MTRALQGMGLALAAAYVYSLAILVVLASAIGGLRLQDVPFLLLGAAAALLPFPILVIAALGLFAGVVVGHCAAVRPVSQAWVEGAVIGALFGVAAAGLLALYFHFVLARHNPGSFSAPGLFFPIIPYAAVWGALVEARWAHSAADN